MSIFVNFILPYIQKREVICKFQSTPYPETRGVLVNFNLPGGPYPEAIIEGRGRPGALSRNGKGISKFQNTPYPETGGY